jgi:hypothetical protein
MVVVQVQVASSGAGEGPDPQLVVDKIRGAREGMENIRLLGDRNAAVVSKVKDGPADLDAADSFQLTYLQPLRIFNLAIAELADVCATLLGWKRANQVA